MYILRSKIFLPDEQSTDIYPVRLDCLIVLPVFLAEMTACKAFHSAVSQFCIGMCTGASC